MKLNEEIRCSSLSAWLSRSLLCIEMIHFAFILLILLVFGYSDILRRILMQFLKPQELLS